MTKKEKAEELIFETAMLVKLVAQLNYAAIWGIPDDCANQFDLIRIKILAIHISQNMGVSLYTMFSEKWATE